MAVESRTSTLVLVDCSASMGRERPFELGEGDSKTSTMRSGLDVAKEYVRCKMVRRIIRELKTTPIGVLLFGYPKTKNLLTTRAKENAAEREEKFDRANDPYRHCYELIPLRKEMDTSLLEPLELAAAGQADDGDAFTAVILGIETLEVNPAFSNFTKELCVLTDGESEINWDGLENAATQMNMKGISLSVIGIDFDDPEIGFKEENKSEMKRTNEANFHDLVSRLGRPSLVQNARRAINDILMPQIKSVASRPDRMTLKLGDTVAHPDSSLTMWVDVKKATSAASAPTMKQMSMRGFARTQAQSQSQSQAVRAGKRKAEEALGEAVGSGDDEEAKAAIKAQQRFELRKERELKAQLSAGEAADLGRLGVLFDKQLQNEGLAVGDEEDADLASHGVLRENVRFYRPHDQTLPARSRNADADLDMDEADGDAAEAAARRWRPVNEEEVELTPAYYYGRTLVPVGDLEDDVGTLKGNETGMEIVYFMKESELRYDYRMGDVFYVYAARGNTGSEKLFSAFVHGMVERKSVAVVRFVKKGGTRDGQFRLPDPMIGILYPTVTEDGVEYCYWARMPFAEDIRALDFQSLERLFNKKGRRITEHKLLPTEPMLEAMDSFVDSMDLTAAGPPDKDGNPTDFFHVEDSYSPSIHNVQNTLIFRMCNPEGTLPPPPPVLTRYMDPPATVAARAQAAAKRVQEVCDVRIVPPKLRKINKQTQKLAADDNISYEALFGSAHADELAKLDAGAAPSVEDAKLHHVPPPPEEPQEKRGSPIPAVEADDEIMIVEQEQKPSQATPAAANPANEDGEAAEQDSEEEEEGEPDTEDEDNADADANAGNDEVVTTPDGIVRALDEAQRLVETSFSWGRYDHAKKVILAARRAAEQLGDPVPYNERLRRLVDEIRGTKKGDFLKRLQAASMGLIAAGATTQDEAQQFLNELASPPS